MTLPLTTLRLAIGALVLAAAPVLAGVPEDVARLQQEWEQIKYALPAAEQEARLARLSADAARLNAQHPGSADLMIWHAIIESTYAGAKGGLGALAHAKAARATLEQALAINPAALGGSAYTSLGSLYYQVPGWPIGFGDAKKAEQMLRKGLAINPDGIDPNYFYGEFLLRQGEPETAAGYLRKALQAPPRPGRKLADEGRRREAQQLLDKIAARRQ